MSTEMPLVNLRTRGEDAAWMKGYHLARLLAHVTGLVNQELLLQVEYLVAENHETRSMPKSRRSCACRNAAFTQRSRSRPLSTGAGIRKARWTAAEQTRIDVPSAKRTDAVNRRPLVLYQRTGGSAIK